jgi:hypothetical protein
MEIFILLIDGYKNMRINISALKYNFLVRHLFNIKTNFKLLLFVHKY